MVALVRRARALGRVVVAGDRVRFVPVSTAECRAIEAAACTADFDPMQWLDSAPTPAENAA